MLCIMMKLKPLLFQTSTKVFKWISHIRVCLQVSAAAQLCNASVAPEGAARNLTYSGVSGVWKVEVSKK